MEIVNEDLITYSEQSHNIILLSKEDEKSLYDSILDDSQKAIVDYTKINFENEKSYLFEFLNELNKKQFSEKIQKLVADIIEKNKSSILNTKGILILNNADEFYLTYSNLCAIVNFIIHISKSGKQSTKTSDILYNFAYEMKTPTIKVTILNQSLSKILNDFISVKKINICLSKDFDEFDEEKINSKSQIDINVVRLFGFFFKSFFPNVTFATIDLNIYPINNYFNNNQNPYKINEKNIIQLSEYHSNLLISNLLMIGSLAKLLLISLNIKMLDSYQIETHYILTKLFSKNNELKTDTNNVKKINKFEKNEKENPFTNASKFSDEFNNNMKLINYSDKLNNSFLFFQHIILKSESEYREFKFEINSLDPLLFNYINILLDRYKYLRKLSLIFFPEKIANKRKTAINNYYFNLYCNNKNKIKYSDNDKKVYYRFLSHLVDNENEKDNDCLLVKNENILNELFSSFNKNLNIFSLILKEKLPDLVTISLNFCFSYNDNLNLADFDTYNSAFICFLFNLFKSLEKLSKDTKFKNMLNLIEIYCDSIIDENVFLIESIKHKYLKERGVFDLRKLKISNIKFSVPNITLFISLDYFPFEKLQELILMNLTYNDLVNISENLSKNKKFFPELINFEIGLNYMIEDYKPPLKLLLKDCIVNPKVFTLTIPFNLSFEEMVEVFNWIKRNNNKKTYFHLKLSNSELSPLIGQSCFIHNVEYFYENVKTILMNNNIICQFKALNYNKFCVYFKILDIKNINSYLAFIHCFNAKKNNIKNFEKRVEEAWEKNCNIIFENIFYYEGKFEEKMILVEIV